MVQCSISEKIHKFGLKLPKTVNEAYAIDEKNRNLLWWDAIQNEMENINIAFQTIPEGNRLPNGFQYVDSHMVCLVVGGNMSHTPDTITYSSVITRETVCIALTMAVLHDLEIKADDVLNAYVMAPNYEKIWTVWGQEFGDDAGKSAIIVRALYCLKSVGASFQANLAQCMQELVSVPCDADPDLWMKAKYRPEDKLQLFLHLMLCGWHFMYPSWSRWYWKNWMCMCCWNLDQSKVPTCIWAQSWNACNNIMAFGLGLWVHQSMSRKH